MSNRLILSLFAMALAWCPFPKAGLADLGPDSGTVTGYYHRDSLGVGHFGYWYVAPELHEKLSGYEGKLIRLEVTRAKQVMNPGPSIILAVGRIEELPQPPLKLSIETNPNPVVAGRPFYVLLHLTDTRRPGAEVNPDELVPEGMAVQFHVPQSQQADSNKPSPLLPQYTRRQLALSTCGGQIEASAWPFADGRPNFIAGCARLVMRPGDCWTWVVLLPAQAAAGDGWAKAMARYLIDGEVPGEKERTVTEIEAWQDVPVRPAPATTPASAPAQGTLRLEDIKLSATGEDGWVNLQFRLLPAPVCKPRVPATVARRSGTIYANTYANIGLLEAFDADGNPVTLQVERTPFDNMPDSARARFVDLPEAGAVITGRFRKDSRFAPTAARLRISFVTKRGSETLALCDDYHDPDVAPQTPFGPAVDSVKIRLRPASPTLKSGQAPSFYVQAVNTSGKPVCWWRPLLGYGENVIVELDGKPLQLPAEKAEYIGGWAAQWTVPTPNDWTVTLPDTVWPAPGRHSLRYTITSKGGEYMNASQQPIPLVNGRVVSNEATFTVR